MHRFGELFLCRPSLGRVIFVSTIQLSYPSIPLHGELFLCRPSIRERYSRANPLILHPLESYFDVYHILSTRPSLWRVIFVPSLPWATYFRASYLILQSLASYFRADHISLHLSILLASYFCAVYPLGELFSCLPFNSLSFGELFFMLTI